MDDCQHLLYADPNSHFEVYQSTLSHQLVVKVCDQLSVKEVNALLQSFIPCKSMIPSDIGDVQATRSKSNGTYRLQWVSEWTESADMHTFARENARNLKRELEEYTFGDVVYENADTLSPVEVSEAFMGPLKRPVIVKKRYCDPSSLNLYLKEAQLQTKVDSLHTCRLLDISLRKGLTKTLEIGLVMEKLDSDLSTDIKQREQHHSPYSEKELMQILDDVTDALLFAKFHGVAHRDIKPANIFIDGQHYKLGDFGSACEIHSSKTILPDGTLHYLCPEVRRLMMNEAVEVDYFQSDVFSLGITMLQLAKLTYPNSVVSVWNKEREFYAAVEMELNLIDYSAGFFDLVRNMLRYNSLNRPTVEEIREYVLFTYLPNPKSSQEDLARLKVTSFAGGFREEDIKQEIDILKRLSHCKKTTAMLYTDTIEELSSLYFSQLRFSEGLSLLKKISANSHKHLTVLRNLQMLLSLLYNGGASQQITVILHNLEKLKASPEPIHNDIIGTYMMLGICYMMNNQFDEAQAAFEDTVKFLPGGWIGDRASLPRHAIHNPSDKTAWLNSVFKGLIAADIGQMVGFFGLILNYLNEGRRQEAEELLVKAQSLQKRLPQEDLFSQMLYFLCVAYSQMLAERINDSEAAFKKALNFANRFFRQKTIYSGMIIQGLALCRIKEGDFENAEKYLQQCMDLFDSYDKGESQWSVMNYMMFAKVYESQGRLSEAETVLELLLEQYPHISWNLRQSIGISLAGVNYKLGELEANEAIYLQLLPESYAHSDADHPYSLSLLLRLASDYYFGNRWLEAEPFYIQIIEISSQLYGEVNMNSADAQLKLFVILSASGREAESKIYLKKSKELLGELLEPDHLFRRVVEAMYTKKSYRPLLAN